MTTRRVTVNVHFSWPLQLYCVPSEFRSHISYNSVHVQSYGASISVTNNIAVFVTIKNYSIQVHTHTHALQKCVTFLIYIQFITVVTVPCYPTPILSFRCTRSIPLPSFKNISLDIFNHDPRVLLRIDSEIIFSFSL